MIYFDNSATTPISEEVANAVVSGMLSYGNPSSRYEAASKSKYLISSAREYVSQLLNCKPEEIYFTSCGTESDNLGMIGYCMANKDKGKHIITTQVEHSAVLNTCKYLEEQGFEVTYLDVNRKGMIDVDEYKQEFRDDTLLVSIMAANNELGTVFPIKKLSRIAHEHNVVFFSDCVQYTPHFKTDVQDLGIDMLSLSGHKFFAPKGVGIFFKREGINILPIMHGGHQENNLRPGTENVPYIFAIGIAAYQLNEHYDEWGSQEKELGQYFREQLMKEDFGTLMNLNGYIKDNVPGIINVRFRGIEGRMLQTMLAEHGVCCSVGSACSSGEQKPSHVLKALKLSDKQANESIRFSLNYLNTKEEIDETIKILKSCISMLLMNE